MIPIGRPDIDESDIEAVTRVLSGASLIQGPEVGAFESELQDRLEVEHVVVTTSGTAAVLMALLALGTGPGDEVLVTAYSWISTANVIALCGATPVFVDIDVNSLAMDPVSLRETMHRVERAGRIQRVKAIMPVHPFGYIADMAGIKEIADPLGIPVVEDAACALGARLDGKPAGSIGKLGCFSFHALKVITTGEGGAIATPSAELADFVRAYRNHGQVRRDGQRRFAFPGANLRMTEFQAALGRSQLARLDDILAERRALAERYRAHLARLPLSFQDYESARTTAQGFVVRLDEDVERGRLLQELRVRGIEAGTGTIAMPFSDYFREHGAPTRADLARTAQVDRTALSLPLYNGMSLDDQDHVIESLSLILTRSSVLFGSRSV
ncbi:MAG: DegT/DnrJ/EryC1/StrS family aminotransferase [Acidimicrobiia bacterium]